MEEMLLELKNITKQFPSVLANDQVNLAIKKGEIHAIVGENGAGKSTLMNILYGLFEPTAGQIFYKGREVVFKSPLDSIALGIGMVHQHFKLLPSFTVAGNMMLGIEPVKNKLFINRGKMVEETKALSERYGLQVDPYAKVEDLSVGIQQRVEILKALYKKADVLILDEPTAVLTPQETKELFAIIKNLVDHLGKTIIIITHKLQEVIAISDRVSVMRQGKMIGTAQTKDVNETLLSEMMVGREVLFEGLERRGQTGDEMLRVQNLYAWNQQGKLAVKDMSFSLKAGEILGVAGIEGNGQSELIQVLTGMSERAGGHIYIRGQKVEKASPDAMRQKGLAHVPEDRIATGLAMGATLWENLLMGSQNKKQFKGPLYWLKKKETLKSADEKIKKYDVRTSSAQELAQNLSGGNMQKMVVAREFSFDTPILIIAQPTRGVDIGAIELIHQEIMQKRNQGAAILLLSAELDEIFRLTDRVMTMYEGEKTGEFITREVTRMELGLYMTGKPVKGEMGDEKNPA